MNTLKGERKGSSAVYENDMVGMFAERNPLFLTPIIAPTAYDNETVPLPATAIQYGDKGSGVLALIVGQQNTGAATIAAFDATIKVYDIDGLQIGNDIAQQIPATPSGKSVMTELRIDQDMVLRGHTIEITGNIVAPANTSKLVVYLSESAPDEVMQINEAGTPATGSIALGVGNFADGDVIAVGDGTNTPVTFEADSGVKASGTVTVAAGNVSDGDTVEFHGKVFEFDDNAAVTPGNVAVTIGADAEASIDNLITAIESELTVDPTGTVKSAGGAGAFIATVVWGVVGLVGNATVTVVGVNLSKTNMAGGLDAGTAITPGNVGVVIGATNLLSLVNLNAAILAQRAAGTLNMKPTNGGAGTITLQNDNPGDAGNVTITKTGTHITVTGMTGGLDVITVRSLYDAISQMEINIGNMDVDLDVLGEETDAPLAGDTPESATARTGIALWKRHVNKLIEIKAGTDKIPAQGQALAAASTPVVLPALQAADLKAVTEASAAAIKAAVEALNVAVQAVYDAGGPNLQVGEISTLDQSMSTVAVVATTTNLAAGATLCYPAAAATPTAAWDVASLNARGGHAKFVSFTGKMVMLATGVGTFKVYGTNDTNATVASRRWVQIGMFDNTATVRASAASVSVTAPGGSAATLSFAVDLDNLNYRYIYVSFDAATADMDEHYLDMVASY